MPMLTEEERQAKTGRICVVCDQGIPVSRRRDAITCSGKCSTKRSNQARRQRDRESGISHHERYREQRVAYMRENKQRWKWWRDIEERLQPGARSEPIDKQKVYERDGWVCGICTLPVPKDLTYAEHYPCDEYPSLDHIKPLSLGGDHTYDNVQCSHLRCNVEKRDQWEQ